MQSVKAQEILRTHISLSLSLFLSLFRPHTCRETIAHAPALQQRE